MLNPTSVVMGAGLGQDVALITDGRFSGGSYAKRNLSPVGRNLRIFTEGRLNHAQARLLRRPRCTRGPGRRSYRTGSRWRHHLNRRRDAPDQCRCFRGRDGGQEEALCTSTLQIHSGDDVPVSRSQLPGPPNAKTCSIITLSFLTRWQLYQDSRFGKNRMRDRRVKDFLRGLSLLAYLLHNSKSN